jgi:mRNA interferase HigB
VRVIAKPKLVEFWRKHPDAESPLNTWYTIARKAKWATPNEVTAVFKSASFLPHDVVIFEIGGRGKGYRLSAGMWYAGRCIYVRHIMTHNEYLKRSRNGTL